MRFAVRGMTEKGSEAEDEEKAKRCGLPFGGVMWRAAGASGFLSDLWASTGLVVWMCPGSGGTSGPGFGRGRLRAK